MSVTSVALPPISKRGLVSLWIGIILLLMVGAIYAVWQTPQIGFTIIEEGTGPSPTLSDVALVKYKGRLDDGTVFDTNERAPLPVSQLVPGFTKALVRMKKGGKYEIIIPPQLGYGDKESGPIPAGSTLYFDVELLDFRSEQKLREMQQQMQQQQMRQQQMQQRQQQMQQPKM